jgi:dipeptidyl aminopeptidase/acylaminoacyl peptidase
MKTVACLAAAALIAAASASTVAAPLEAYGGLPSVEQVAISPDGKDLALIVTNGDQRALVIETAADQKPFGIVKLGDAKLRVIEWVGDHHVLMTISVHGALQTPYGPILGGGDEHLVAIDYDTADHRQTFLMNDVEHALNVVYREPIARIIAGKPIAYLVGQVFPEGEPTGRIALLRSDLDAHDTKVVDLGLPHVTDWAVDDQGRPLAVAAYDAPSATWTLRMRAGDGWRVLKTANAPIERPELAGLGRDGRSLLVADWVDNERAFREVAPDAADWSAPIAHGDEEGIHDPATHALIGFAKLDGDVLDYTFFDAKVAATWRAVQAAYPGQEVQLISVSDDRRKLVVRVDSPTDGPAYALVDLDTGAAGWIANEYEGLKAGDIAQKRAIALKAADGLALSGYLTLPPGKPEKALPLVVLVHGGPAARDTPGFDWWAQALASRGYAVLQVNYRGSDGFGWSFLSAGFGQWGRKMQTDVSDGVRYLAAQGTVDPKRVCIVGASYGGYAALAGATIDKGVYRCAVSIAGPSDLHRMIADDKNELGRQAAGVERYWFRFMGASSANDPALDAVSPARLADRDDIPILLIHGADDTTVPFVQSQLMADALRRAGKSVELVTLRHEDHYLSHGDTRLQMLQASIDFLEKNNPPN